MGWPRPSRPLEVRRALGTGDGVGDADRDAADTSVAVRRKYLPVLIDGLSALRCVGPTRARVHALIPDGWRGNQLRGRV